MYKVSNLHSPTQYTMQLQGISTCFTHTHTHTSLSIVEADSIIVWFLKFKKELFCSPAKVLQEAYRVDVSVAGATAIQLPLIRLCFPFFDSHSSLSITRAKFFSA